MARKLGFIAVFAVCLVAPQAAEAGELSREGTTIVFTETEHFEGSDDLNLFKNENDYVIEVNSGPISLDEGDSGCTEVYPGGFLCSDVSSFRFELGQGDDKLAFFTDNPFDARVDIPLVVDGGEGQDEIEGGTANDVLRGGASLDWVNGYEGDDLLDPGLGLDTAIGGPGEDTVTYADRTEPLRVDLGSSEHVNGSANDEYAPEPGLRDSFLTVEGVIGGSGDDFLTGADTGSTIEGRGGSDNILGGAGVDVLDGGDGADDITPLGGEDQVLAGAGFDVVEARDDAADDIDCGADGDLARADAIDVLTSCDPPPPVVETVTVVEKEQVLVKETVPGPARVTIDLGYSFSAGRRSTKLQELWLDTEPGAAVRASCRTRTGRTCARTRTLASTTPSGHLRLRGFERRALPVGAVLTLSVTKDGMVGAVKTLTIRKRKAPSLRTTAQT